MSVSPSPGPVQYFSPPEAAAMGVPFSKAVRVDDVLYLSGALGNRPGTKKLAPGGIEAETRQTMENTGAVLRANGGSADHVSNVWSCWPT